MTERQHLVSPAYRPVEPPLVDWARMYTRHDTRTLAGGEKTQPGAQFARLHPVGRRFLRFSMVGPSRAGTVTRFPKPKV